MKKKKIYGLLAGSVAAAGLLSACGGNDSSQSEGDSEVVELDYWRSSETGRPDYEAFMSVVERF